MTKYTTASGVTYNITQPDTDLLIPIYDVWDVTITAPDGSTIYTGTNLSPGIDVLGVLQLAASGYVLTGTDNYDTLISAASNQTIVTAPGSTGDVDIGVGAAEADTYYIGGDNTISGLVSAITGTTINVVGGTATLTGNSGGSLVGLLTGSTVNIEYGGTFNTGAALVSVLEGGTVNFGTGGGTLILNGGGTVISLLASGTLSGTTLNNYDPAKDTIELQGTTGAISAYSIQDSGSGGKTITMLNSAGQTVAEYAVKTADGVTLPDGNYSTNVTDLAANPLQVTYADDNTYIGACFLADSMIETPSGQCAVQDLRIGDEIIAYAAGSTLTRRVIWAGRKKETVRMGLPDDEAGYPIRILRNAVAEGVPCKDMLITAEHCLFFEGGFIPARMLVNNRSVFYDRSITAYEYYHIETEEHSIIKADGMLTESYLDTGNRGTFQQNGAVVSIGRKPVRSWAEDAAAPLTVAPEVVEPVFRMLESRALQAGHAIACEPPALSDDADLHLMTPAGSIIRKMRDANGYAFFMIPPGVETVRILSRTSRPADTIGPYVDDRRQLGVLVRNIKLFEGSVAHAIATHLAPQAPEGWYDGWYAPRNEPCRWTDGQATLHLGQRRAGSMGLLCLEIMAGGPYNMAAASDVDPEMLRLTA
nr:Hint domain-containing protein [Komagataeibacter melomenusus]